MKKFSTTEELSKFERLIPPDGLKIFPEMTYYDVNDVDAEIRHSFKKYFQESDEYKPYYENRFLVDKGNEIGRRFCVYVYHKENLLGNFLFVEFLDSPFGYGKDDFYYSKWVCRDYQNTKHSRYASGDLFHFIFFGGVMKRLYSLPVADESGGIDPTQPCIGAVYPSDSPKVQKYIITKKIIPTEWKTYILREYSGEIYMSMDLKAYLLANPKRTEEVAVKWIREMDKAAEKVREYHESVR